MAEDLKLWKRRARNIQQHLSNSLSDRIFDEVTEEQLALKVGYAIYNAPSEVDEKTKSAVYKKAEESHIKLVCDKVKLLHPEGEKKFYISYLFIVIRLRNKKSDEGIQVLFRVPKFKEGKPILNQYDFIDPKPRRYETWNDYLCKNKLPKCDMCYPVNGIYTDIDGSVNIQFGTSPACDISTAVLSGLDVSSTVLMVAATGVSLVSLAVPIAAPFVWGATASVLASGTYETARNLYQLHDIKKHGESLKFKNPDSRSVWLNLASSVVGMASIGTTAIAAKGVAATESALTRAGIVTLRVLNVSSLAVSGIGVVDGIITLVMKHINGTLKAKDILQFTSDCLFFLNALVTYNLASRVIEELARSDFSSYNNLYNLRQNTTFRAIKCVMDFKDSNAYSKLRQLALGVRSVFYPDISTGELESMALEFVSLLDQKLRGKITDIEFFKEIFTIMHKIWDKYQNSIMKVVDDIKKSLGTPDWQQITPSHKFTNFEIPLQMCKKVERVGEICGISDNSYERKHLMILATKFARTHGNMKEQDFINRFKLFCDNFVAQFKEEREKYENELDSQNATKDFVRSDFDRSYKIEGNKIKFFFYTALDKFHYSDFLTNINELYENLPPIEETCSQLPNLKTERSKIYIFCGPSNEKELSNDYYWDKASDLSGIKTNSKNSVITKKNDLVVIQPISNTEVADVEMANQLTELEAIVIYTTFLDNCHMGLMMVIQKWKRFTNAGPNFSSQNYYQVLTPSDDSDSDHVNSELDTHDKVSKILICADSHGIGLSWHVNEQIDELRWRGDIRNNEIFLPVSFVRPGGQTSQILSERNIKEELVNERDILVVISGTDDVARNEGDDALAKIEETLNKFSEKRIILVDLPNRHDLPAWSCVNLATKKTNKGLQNLSEKFVNVTLVQASKAERYMHTAHGMHLKPSGKKWLAERICEAAGISKLKSTSISSPNTSKNQLGKLPASTARPQPLITPEQLTNQLPFNV